ncbi:MAG: antirestriction protein ArdA, partial [Oscillospiraceae bacterium]|nr:antirestriction protein ArdA [Oscillospiraceae bacterium]
AAYESPIDGLTDRFRPGESLDELNYLAALLAQRSQEEREKFAAAMIHGDHAASIADAVNLTHNLDCYWLYPTVHNSEDYGHYVVDELDELELPEAAKKYFDYKAFGRDAAREDGGTFTDYGYIYNNKNDFAVWYADHDIPKEHRITPDQPDTVFMDAAAVSQQAAAVTEPQQPIPIRPIELIATDTAGKVKEITAQLEAGVKDLFNSERYQDYLKAMSKFHDYSLNNTLLIVMQKPDASLVAGFNKWRDEFERHVKRGEKGIKILAPAPYKIKKEQEKLDPDGKPIIGEDGKPVTEQKEITVPAFKVVSVFDVSQTDGKEIPDIAVDSLTGSVEQYEDFFKALEQTSPVPVGFERIESGAHGYYHNAEKRIALNKGESELQTVKTLIHEIAHAKLHDIDLNAPPEQQQERPSRRTREVEAESIAYTVCQHFGLDTSDYSFGYVAGWSSDKDIKELKASLETIRATASELITEIDGHFRELQQQREAAQEERPVLESLDPEQQQAIRDEVQATLQMLVNADMQISGEVSQGTLDALTAQGYVLQDGVVQRMQQAELPMPDPTITVQEMNEYGYKWDGMLPLQEEAARRLFENEGVEIYRIYEDNTEGAVLNADEITEHAAQGGIFGVEKEAWQRHLEKPQQE